MPSSASHSDYVLGTDDIELRRLAEQHALWLDRANTVWQQAGLRRGQRVLDAGCGPGFVSLEMARIVAAGQNQRGRVVGVDGNAGFLDHARRLADSHKMSNMDFVESDVRKLGDALERQEPFDLAYLRWVLCFVDDVDAVIAGIARRLAPGGRIVIQDYFHYDTMTIAPKDDRWHEFMLTISRSWRDSGGDPDVMQRVPALLHKHGFEIDHLGATGPRVVRPTDTMWTWPAIFWQSFVPRLVETGYMTEQQAEEVHALWADRENSPDSFFLLPVVLDCVATRKQT
ncbi:MAG: methyltransferase domain-containing protein [Planctomycetota bacterium]